MSQIGVGRRGGRGDLDRRIEADARPARDVRELQAVDVALIEVVAGRHDELGGRVRPFAVGAGAGLPADLHAVGVEEVDLALGIDEPAAAAAPWGRPGLRPCAAAVYGGRPGGVGRDHGVRTQPFLQSDARVANIRIRRRRSLPPAAALRSLAWKSSNSHGRSRPARGPSLRSVDRGECLSS